MAKLYIECPATGKEVFTGVDFPEGKDRSVYRNNTVGCPHCGASHVWDGTGAFFAGRGGPAGGGADATTAP